MSKPKVSANICTNSSAVALSLCECWKWEAAQCHNHGLSVKRRIQVIPTFAAIINIKSIYVVTFSVPIMISVTEGRFLILCEVCKRQQNNMHLNALYIF